MADSRTLSPDRLALLRQLVAERGLDTGANRIVRGPRPGTLPLSYSQQRLWFLDRLLPERAVYNIAAVLELHGELDPAALNFALEQVVERQEALRTAFTSNAGVPAQVVHAAAPAALEPIDLSGLPPEARQAEAARLCAGLARQPFDLSQPGLYRLRLLRLGATEHWLSVTLHHIIADGWSIGVMTRDLCAGYRAFATGGAAPLPKLPVQYADYALWEQARLDDALLSRHFEYWQSRLSGAPTAVDLPFDRPRGRTQSCRGDLEFFSFPAGLSRSLHALSRAEGCTLFTTLLAGFHALLARYSGRGDTVIGTAMANRDQPEIEGLIGFFVNTVPLRVESRAGATMRSLMHDVRETTLDDFAHAAIPFEKMVEALDPARDRSLNPLFQVMFVLQNAPREQFVLPGLRVNIRDVGTGTAKFDLLLSITDSDTGLSGSVEYDTGLFDRSTIVRAIGHLERLLSAAVATPDLPVAALPLMDDDEKRAAIGRGRATPAATDHCVHELFEATARRCPSATAVSCGELQLDYRELDTRANRLAQSLRAMGAGPDDVIGIRIERSIEMAVAVLGVLKAGAAYLPLDPAYPKDRLDYMCADAGASTVLTAANLESLIAPGQPQRDAAPVTPATALNLAYVVYTSGSTGRPKGVCMPHGVLTNLMRWQALNFATSAMRTLQFSSLSFDVSFIEVFTAWSCGGELVIYPTSLRRDPIELARVIRTAGIGFAMLPAAVLEPLCESLTDSDPETLRLRDLVSTAERLRITPAVRRLGERLPGCTVHNHYGPSETSVVTAATLARDTQSWTATPPIGTPVDGAGVYILDARLEPVPVGVAGELFVSGALARGYRNRPGQTASRFLPDPFANARGSRMYRTGDSARWLADGNIEYLGRLDEQLKVRGFRVEPAEVEAALALHPAVRESRVVTAGEHAADRRLLAYVVAAPDQRPAHAALRSFLAQRLPAYLVPSAVVVLDALPLTPNGKLDTSRLPPPSSQQTGRDRAAPRNPLEELLCCIWADVLEVPEVGIFDSFFDLGGHSLLATRLVARVRAALGVELTLDLLFADASVAAIAARLPGMAPADEQSPIEPVPADQPQRIAPAQAKFWALERLMPGSPLFNQPLAVRIEGRLDTGAWTRSVELLAKRHGALRTVFRADGDGAVAVVLPPSAPSLDIIDLSEVDAAEREQALLDVVQDEAATGFDLETGPPFRARLVRLTPQDHVALFTTHHIVADGWTLELLRRELEQAYPVFASGGEPSPAPAVQYADYVARENQWLAGESCAAQLAYWQDKLAALGPCTLPVNRPRPARMSFATSAMTFELSEGATLALRDLARKEGLTPFMIVLAAWQAYLFGLTGETDQRVGTLIANRSLAELQDVCGLLVNTVTVRTQLSATMTFRELLGRVRETTLEAHRHQRVPFDRVVTALEATNPNVGSELFPVLMSWEERPAHPMHLPGLTVKPFVVHEDDAVDITPTASDLWLALTSHERSITAHFTYKVALLEPASIRRWWDDLCRVIGHGVSAPETALSELVRAGPA